ncbi:MAG: SGNH/GDSL hydrolase family protein [Rhodothermales bacterium]|nr:SGNH/GDSL hydrolase family protein [Rhodothermales bacterium]
MPASIRTSRRHFLQLIAGASAVAALPRSAHAAPADLVWRDVRDWGIEGKGWMDTKRYFDRLPGKAEGVVRPPVWDLSRHSAGQSVRFVTDAPAIHVRYTLLSDRLAMPHMPATGVSGLDLYATDDHGVDRWAAVVQPEAQTVEKPAAEGLRPGKRRYTVYLPLYNGVESLEIAVDAGASFEPLAPRAERPILFYGTSIMHGACASRPGISISAILGRRLNRPVINLGFSGNGRMEPEVGALLAELDPCVFALDCLPNMDAAGVDERAAPLVRQLRAAHPDTPVLLVEDRSFTNTRFFPAREEHHRNSREALRRTYARLLDDGVDRLYYLDGEQLLGDDGEAATDGSHPNDLGMVRYADAYEPALRAALGQY